MKNGRGGCAGFTVVKRRRSWLPLTWCRTPIGTPPIVAAEEEVGGGRSYTSQRAAVQPVVATWLAGR